MSADKFWDKFFALYFVLHVVIVVFFDSQVLFPAEWFPTVIRNIELDYAKNFKDNMVLQPPVWYKSFVFCEFCLQTPFLLLASYAFVKGGCRWIRMPAILYGTHTATTLIPILAHIFYYDFSKDKLPGPTTMEERLKLGAIYVPFFIWPVLLVYRMLVSDFYCGRNVKNEKRSSTKKTK